MCGDLSRGCQHELRSNGKLPMSHCISLKQILTAQKRAKACFLLPAQWLCLPQQAKGLGQGTVTFQMQISKVPQHCVVPLTLLNRVASAVLIIAVCCRRRETSCYESCCRGSFSSLSPHPCAKGASHQRSCLTGTASLITGCTALLCSIQTF